MMVLKVILKAMLILLVAAATVQQVGAAEPPRFAISQVGLHFICTADGQPDMYSWRLPVPDRSPSAQLGDFLIPEVNPADLEGLTTGALPSISGGRTALKLNENIPNTLQIDHYAPAGFYDHPARLKNAVAVGWNDGTAPEGKIKLRYYSNYPPMRNSNNALFYGVTVIPSSPGSHNYGRYYRHHPGYDYQNWNWTLDYAEEGGILRVDEKRLQAMFYLELHYPPISDPAANLNYTFVISAEDISTVFVSNRSVFSHTSDVAVKTEKSLFTVGGVTGAGGFIDMRKLALGRRMPPTGKMPEDFGYDNSIANPPSGKKINLDLASQFFTVKSDQFLRFSSGPMTLRIYDTHDWQNATPIQTVQFSLPPGEAPPPDLVTVGTNQVSYLLTPSSIYYHPAVQAPRWWSFHRDGALGRFDPYGGSITNVEMPEYRSTRGRLYRWDGAFIINNEISAVYAFGAPGNQQRMPGARALIYGYDALLYPDVSQVPVADLMADRLKRIEYEAPSFNRPKHYGSDTMRTIASVNQLIPKAHISADEWRTPPDYNNSQVHLAYGLGFDEPVIKDDPISQTKDVGQSVTFSTAALSTVPVTYQWRRNQTPIPDATAATYTLAAVAKSHEGNYDVVVTSTAGNDTSKTVSLSVNDPVVTEPEDQTVALGGSASFSVTAQGTGLHYQWRLHGRDIANATQATLTLPQVKVSDQGAYDVVVHGTYGTVTSETAQLTVNSPLAIVKQPVGGKFLLGPAFDLQVNATGTAPIHYQWRRSKTPIPGKTVATLTLPGEAASAGSYDVIVTHEGGTSVISATAVVAMVEPPPVILTQPVSLNLAVGEQAQFSLTAIGGTLTYQWRRDQVDLVGMKSATLAFTAQDTSGGIYDCVVRNSQGAVLSAPAALTLGTTLTFDMLPEDQAARVGETATFTAAATASLEPTTYQWAFNDKAIPGAVYTTLIVPDAAVSLAGRYSITATRNGQKGTASAQLRVLDAGTLIYKLTGTGLFYIGTTAERMALAGQLLVDRSGQTARAALLLTRKEGRTSFFEVQQLDHFHSNSTALLPKSQTALNDVTEDQAGNRFLFWLTGTDNLVALPKAGSILAPKTLSGSANQLDLGSGDGVVGTSLQSISFKASLDTSSTAISFQKEENLDEALDRLSVDLLLKGQVEIPEEAPLPEE